MLVLFCLTGYSAPHPTDVLPVSESQVPGLQVIIGGKVVGTLNGHLGDGSEKHELSFKDDGNEMDVDADDGVWIAHVDLNQKGGEAPLVLTMDDTVIWQEPIPIGQVRDQLYLKILINDEKTIVKVDTFDTDAPPPEESPPPPEDTLSIGLPQTITDNAPLQATLGSQASSNQAQIVPAPPPPSAKPSAPFYESTVLLQTLSSLIFLAIGFFVGDRFRRSRPDKPLRWLYLGHGQNPPSRGQLLLMGQRQCWACSESMDREALLEQFTSDLQGAGPLLLLADPERHASITRKLLGRPGIFVSNEVPTTLEEAQRQVRQLRRLGNPIVIIDGLKSLESAQANEPPEAVLQDVMYWLPEGCSILALVSSSYSGIVQQTLTSVSWPGKPEDQR